MTSCFSDFEFETEIVGFDLLRDIGKGTTTDLIKSKPATNAATIDPPPYDAPAQMLSSGGKPYG